MRLDDGANRTDRLVGFVVVVDPFFSVASSSSSSKHIGTVGASSIINDLIDSCRCGRRSLLQDEFNGVDDASHRGDCNIVEEIQVGEVG